MSKPPNLTTLDECWRAVLRQRKHLTSAVITEREFWDEAADIASIAQRMFAAEDEAAEEQRRLSLRYQIWVTLHDVGRRFLFESTDDQAKAAEVFAALQPIFRGTDTAGELIDTAATA